MLCLRGVSNLVSLVTHRVGRRLLGAVASLALAAGGAAALPSASASPTPSTGSNPSQSFSDKVTAPNTPPAGRYVVVMRDQPEAAYDGHVPGLAATRPNPGQQLTASADVARYRGYLESRQDQALARVGSPAKIYSYTTAVSGFAAQLSGRQVVGLRKNPNIVSVTRDKLVKLETVDSPEFLGLSGPNGEWAQHGGPAKAGKNTVVGIVDTGIWPESKSFEGTPRVGDVPGFEGRCEQGERFPRNTCNSKIISARYFIKGIGRSNVSRHDFISPRDGNGHGSHTAGTAAGNHGVPVRIEGQYLGKASGMAPAAKIAVYKVCWEAKIADNSGCYTSDTVAAINKATQDGVDVINYSISGSQDDFNDPVERAFLGAASAGVFVAASAGNSGPFRMTVAHPSPWIATVAASTHHVFPGKVVLGNGKSYTGAMISDQAVSMRRIILSSDARAADAGAEQARLCRRGSLDRDKVEGRIVVCDRGIIDRVAKSAAVKRAGGVGMVLVNTTPDSIVADFHAVPTVHLKDTDGAKVKNYVDNAGRDARARLDPDAKPYESFPRIAGFSSRGPLIAGNGDILKPDLSAPGVSVVAAVAPPFNFGHKFDLYSGTSMSSPHIAGLGAFISHLRPIWTPAMIKSAMMTTAYDLKGAHNPFIQGAGHVNPRRFLDPGLTYDAGPADYLSFLNGEVKASNVNQASIAVGDLAGKEKVKRVVTNVSDEAETYTAIVRGLEGVNAVVEPARFRVASTRVHKFAVNFTAQDGADLGKWTSGTLVLRGNKGHVVRSPIVVEPVAVAVEDEVLVPANTTSGETRISGKAGFTGLLDLRPVGLDGATPTKGTVQQGEFQYIETVKVTDRTSVARFDLNAENDLDDLDLYAAIGNTIVAVSATGAADEQITLKNPQPGDYDIYVYGYAANDSDGANYIHTGWAVPNRNKGNFSVRPDPVQVTVGERFHYTARWTNLDINKRYFGYVSYKANGNPTGERTYVTVN